MAQHDQDAFPRLSEELIERLRAYGHVRQVEAGDVLFQEGDEGYDFFLILSGSVRITERAQGEPNTLGVRSAREFLGELNMLTGEKVIATARVEEPGAVLVVPQERLREIVATQPELSDLILEAFLSRRTLLLEGAAAGLKILGSRFSQETLHLREFAARNQLPHTWIDLEADAEAEALLQQFGIAPEETPVVILRSDRVLRSPTVVGLARHVGLRVRATPAEPFDLIVVGAGPAGLAASVYGASEGLSTVTLEAIATGGQAGNSSKIENYLGFPSGLSGAELANRARVQAAKFGARLTTPCEAVALRSDGGYYVVDVAEGQEVVGRSVVIATGARYRKLPLERLDVFEGAGVYYAATETEARLCREDTAVVVGGGNSAGQAAMFLSERARKVYLLIRGDDLTKNMSRYLVNRIRRSERVDVRTHTEVTALEGNSYLERLVVRNNQSGEERALDVGALFVFIGAEPYTAWLGGALALDAHGFIQTGPALKRSMQQAERWARLPREPFLLETSLPGVFAAGDVRSGSVKRVASAVGEGSIAMKFVHEHLAGNA